MQILRKGNLRKVNPYYRFECSACDCIWLAESEEVHKSSDRDGVCLYSMACPTCEKTGFGVEFLGDLPTSPIEHLGARLAIATKGQNY